MKSAVMAAPIDTSADLADRPKRSTTSARLTNFEPLAASFKRIKNILQTSAESQLGPLSQIRSAYAGPEQDLYEASRESAKQPNRRLHTASKLALIASLRPQVDLFFDKILSERSRSGDPAEPPGFTTQPAN